jgi:DNA-directed RNA polymerase subunit RPC12/RpoP
MLPEDAALYVCGCGNAFTAAVTASVTCPSCGDGQAW